MYKVVWHTQEAPHTQVFKTLKAAKTRATNLLAKNDVAGVEILEHDPDIQHGGHRGAFKPTSD